MLSFLSQDTCQQLADGAIRNTCEWAMSNPMLALGISAGTAAIAATTGGLYWLKSRPQVQAVNNKPVVARLTREAIRETVSTVVPVATAAIVNPIPAKLPSQTIVLAYLMNLSSNDEQRKVALQLRDLRKTQQKTTDAAVLKNLGLPQDGTMPTTQAGQMKYEQVLDSLALSHLKYR